MVDHIPAFYVWQKQLLKEQIRGLLVVVDNDPFVDMLLAQELAQAKILIDAQKLTTSNNKKRLPLSKLLGTECDLLYFDASLEFDANLFTALSGTLKAGACLLLKLSKGSQVPFPNIEKKPQKNQFDSPLLTRLISFSASKNDLGIVKQDSNHFPVIPENTEPSLEAALIAQRQVISQIKRVATGHAKRPLVLTADRGRGKSAALGIAAGELINSSSLKIIVTAPTVNNLDSFYRHLGIQDQDQDQDQDQRNMTLPNGACLSYWPLDKLIAEKPEAGLILVDEAAAFPVQMLERLPLLYNRLVFATTVHGYEGNGNGFEIKFKHKLLNLMPQTRYAQLSKPIRWSDKDTLEPLIFKTFLLDCKLRDLDKRVTSDALRQSLKVEKIHKNRLAQDENLLREIFALLVNAHYQTRPVDLEQILVNPSLKVYALMQKEHPIAVALVNQEGQLAPAVCQPMALGKKRIKGELLPQSLVTHSGIAELGEKNYWRIMRIAVHPQAQNIGLGSLLLNNIETLAKKENSDFLGASFASEPKVVAFWLSNNYKLIRFGSSKDSSSGSLTCELLKPLTKKAKSDTIDLCNRFERAFEYKLGAQLKDINPEIIALLYNKQFRLKSTLTEAERQELRCFAEGDKGLQTVDWLAVQLVKSEFGLANKSNKLNQQEENFLIDALITQKSNSHLSECYALEGKKQINQKLRQLVASLL